LRQNSRGRASPGAVKQGTKFKGQWGGAEHRHSKCARGNGLKNFGRDDFAPNAKVPEKKRDSDAKRGLRIYTTAKRLKKREPGARHRKKTRSDNKKWVLYLTISAIGHSIWGDPDGPGESTAHARLTKN